MAKKTINIGTSVNAGNGDPLRTAFDKINDNFNELYAATTLDLDSIGSNMIPTTDGAYALGSSSKKWSDLYVKDFIYIGNARLESDVQGNLVVNGASIKLDGDITGSVFGDDSSLLVDGINNKIVGTVDANILKTGALVVTGNSISLASTTGSIALTSVSTASISGAGTVTITSSGGQVDITANSKINMSGSEVDILTGMVVRNGITGDLSGSVFADDSTLLVDGTNGTINAGALTGALPAIDGSALTGIGVAFSDLTGKPTTLSGYGITDAANTTGATFTGLINLDGDGYGGSTLIAFESGGAQITLRGTNTNTGSQTKLAGTVLFEADNPAAPGQTDYASISGYGTAVGGSKDTGILNFSVFDVSSQTLELKLQLDEEKLNLRNNTLLQLPILTSAPGSPADGMIAIADGSGWDPLTNGVQTMVVFLDGAWREIANAI